MSTVFLGGTCAGSTWRDKLIPLLKVDYFNPLLGVGAWNDEAANRELKARETFDFVLYVITPLMEGVYSIAEIVDDSNKIPDKTIFCVLKADKQFTFSTHQLKALGKVAELVTRNGAKVCNSLEEVAEFVNNANR